MLMKTDYLYYSNPENEKGFQHAKKLYTINKLIDYFVSFFRV